MAGFSSKENEFSTQMVFIRKTLQSKLLEKILEVPLPLKNRLVEIIVLPINSEKKEERDSPKSGAALKRFAGAWVGELLAREDQGEYETREELF